ncbi:MAG: MFS transporter [Alphaproteobacteria bacterium]|nr:MFS transporter [Alphaproteobacteria bacterium]
MNLRLAVMIATFIVGCGLSHFLRSSHVVIAPSVIADLGLSAESFSLMGSAYFLAYAIGQIPTGLLLDSVGPRRSVSGLLVIAVAGTAWFGLADSLASAFAARVLMGIGCAAVFMGAFYTVARWLGPAKFGTASGMISGFSQFGNLLATTPLAFAAETIGWRACFLWMAGILAVVGVLLYAVIRDEGPANTTAAPRPTETLSSAIAGLVQLLRWRPMYHLLAMALVCYATYATIFSLWAGSYLHDVHGLGPVERGNVMLAMSVSTFVSVMAWGAADRVFNTRRLLVIWGACITAALLGALALWPKPPVWAASLLLIVFSGTGSYSIRVMIHGRALFPEHLSGRGMTTVNLGMSLGAAILQPISGVIVGAVSGPVRNDLGYRAMFGFLAVMTILALMLYRPIADAPPRPATPR